MRKVLRLLPILAIFLCGNVFAQTKSITGTVVSSKDNEGVSNVSVTNKNTKKVDLTDTRGNFKIAASSGDVLEFSSSGYFKKNVTVGSDNDIKVTLEVNTRKESEVVVTAFNQKKDARSLGTGVQTLNGEKEIAETQRDNWMNALTGKVAGLTVNQTSGAPGASSQIVLRGYNSIGGDNSALLVIDGMIINNSVFNQGKLASDLPNRNNDYQNRGADINPEDIETITILKGPEAAALYGTEAGSGAIIITTKKGKMQKMKVTYSNNFGFQQINRFHEVQKVYDNGVNGATANTTRAFFGPKYAPGTKFYNNPLNFFNIGKRVTHNLSLDGGKGLSTYRVNGTYYNQEGVIPNTGLQRINVSATIATKINKKIETTSNVSYYNSYNRKAFRGTEGYYQGLLLWPLDDDARRWQNIAGNRRIISKSGGVDNPAEVNNAFFETNRNKNFDLLNRVTYTTNLVWNAKNWLTFDARIGADGFSQYGINLLDRESFSVYTVGGRLEQHLGRYLGLSSNLLAIARKQIGNFKITTKLGNAMDDRTSTWWSVRGDSVLDAARTANVRGLNVADYTSQTRRINSRTQGRDTLQLQRSIGLFYDINIGYKNFLYLNASGRNDWLAEFPPQNRSYFYPAFNGSFIFSELLPDNNLLTFGKLRGSFAKIGKRVAPYSNQSVYTNAVSSTNGYGNGFGFGVNNPNLFPETQRTVEIGTELKFWKDRISIDLTAYKINIDNSVAANARPSYATGGILLTSNIADLENKGFEGIFSANWVKNKNFDWNTRVTYSQTRNIVTDLALPEFYNSDTWLGNYRASLFRGFPTTTIGGQNYLRNTNGVILISPTTGYPIADGRYSSIGDRNPDFVMGLTNRVRYKNFSLSFTLDLKKGGDVINGTELNLYIQGLSKLTLDREKIRIIPGVLQDGLENTANPTKNTIAINPMFQTDYFQNTAYAVDFVEHDVDWLRLRDITL
jgi:TonB-linked SusC/RagA family outer membrane protein